MEHALPKEYADKVHLKTDLGVGVNWFEAH